MSLRICKRGHVQTSENVYVAPSGRSECHPCRLMRSRRYRILTKVPCPSCGQPMNTRAETCWSCRYQKTEEERFLSYVDESGDCWLWTGYCDRYGYPVFGKSSRLSGKGHRWSYDRWVGPIPEGHDVHHDCGNRACVRPEHLRAVEHGAHTSHHRSRRSHGARAS